MTTRTYRSVDFWAPALHPNTLLHVAVPEPGPSRDPIVRHFAIKHGEHEAVSVVKKMTRTEGGVSRFNSELGSSHVANIQLLLVDDSFKVTQVSVPTEEAPIPTVSAQVKAKVPAKGTVMWSGLSTVQGKAISSLTSGRVNLYNDDLSSESLKLGAPALTLSTIEGSSHFAVAGKELEVTVLDAERAFSASSSKRKADDALPGEVWRAKNLPHNHLRLRQPIYHLASTFVDTPSSLLTGTKAGQVRRYDTRQRKPVHNWAVGKEGAGVQGLARGQTEHEVFFSDLANTLGALDLRTGRVLYQVPNLSATTNWMTTLPHEMENGEKFAADTVPKHSFAGLAAIASDATLRICQTTLPPSDGPVKGNWNTSGNKKSAVLASVGGVGVGSCVFDGFGTHTEVIEKKEKERKEGDDEDDISDEEVDDDEEEEMWEGMGEAEEGSEEEEEDESDEEEEDEPARKRRK